MNPQVSVVIPTIRRPEIVLRAIHSVLAQSFSDFEILVVIDGPDEASQRSLATITDPRVRVLMQKENQGLAQVRNLGVAEACGEWVAFLDDDDEWLPTKLEEQVRSARESGGERVMLSCEFIDSGPNFRRVLPLRKPAAGEPMSEYLFCRKGPLRVQGLVQPSTYFVSTKLLREVPFNSKLRPHEDFDWLMRASQLADRPFSLVLGPQSIYHNEQTQNRESNSGDFDFYWNYAHANRELFTPLAFSFYIAAFCTPPAVNSANRLQRTWQVLRGIVSGKPTPVCLLTFLGFAMFSLESRRMLRNSVSLLRQRLVRQ